MANSTSRRCERLNCNNAATTEVTYDQQPEELGFDSQEGSWRIRLHYRKADLCDEHLRELKGRYPDVTEKQI